MIACVLGTNWIGGPQGIFGKIQQIFLANTKTRKNVQL